MPLWCSEVSDYHMQELLLALQYMAVVFDITLLDVIVSRAVFNRSKHDNRLANKNYTENCQNFVIFPFTKLVTIEKLVFKF